jgi:hypothetical protein
MVPYKDGISTTEASVIAIDLPSNSLANQLRMTLLYNANKFMSQCAAETRDVPESIWIVST